MMSASPSHLKFYHRVETNVTFTRASRTCEGLDTVTSIVISCPECPHQQLVLNHHFCLLPRSLYMFHDLEANDWPADPCAQHVHDQPDGAGSPGGQCFLWGTSQCCSALRARPLLWPEWAAAFKPAPISWAHHLWADCGPVQPGGWSHHCF